MNMSQNQIKQFKMESSRTSQIAIKQNEPDCDHERNVISQNQPILSKKIQNSNALFDPNNSSPASDFMQLLKLRSLLVKIESK